MKDINYRREENYSPPTTHHSPENVAVLIPAAGRGRRMGGERKQFRQLGKASVLVHTVGVFARHSQVDAIVVAAPPGDAATVEQMLDDDGEKQIAVVAGGATRQVSVAAALDAAPTEAGVILVHDAVRPFVAPDTIEAVIQSVHTHGAVTPAIPVADTLRKVSPDSTVAHRDRDSGGDKDRDVMGQFDTTVPRENLYRVQTPQGFRRDWLEEAYADASRRDVNVTDDAELVQRLGHPVHVVPGRTFNFKVTTPDDWKVAQALWDSEVAGLTFDVR